MNGNCYATTIRQYAENVGFQIVGKLKRVPGHQPPLWIDDAKNEYMGNARDGFCIVTADGEVI